MKKQMLCWRFMGFLLLGGLLMGAQEPCGGSCPQGAISGPGLSCLFEIQADGRWRRINGGELKVQIPSLSKAQAGRFAFWFVQDPEERMEPKLKGRIGRWKLLVRNYEPNGTLRHLVVSWRLRDTPDSLASDETVRLALATGGDKGVRILPGEYNASKHRVDAKLFNRRLPFHGLYLIPVRHSLRKVARSH